MPLGVPGAGPLPDVAGHVVQAIAVGWEGADRRSPRETVRRGVLPRELAVPPVGQPAAIGPDLVPPRVPRPVETTPGCVLPLRLGRQVLPGPGGIGGGVLVRH